MDQRSAGASALVVFLLLVAPAWAEPGNRAGTFWRSYRAPAALPPRTVTVTGVGEVRARPDLATLSVGVVTEAPTAGEAIRANSQQMHELLQDLEAQGVAPRDVQSAQVSVQPTWAGGQPPRISGYQATNQVSVRVRDLARLGSLLDGVVQSGANRLQGVEFGFQQPARLQAQARRLAVEDAENAARQLARSASGSLGDVVTIQEADLGAPAPMAMRSVEAGVPIPPGERSVSAQVSVTYELVD
jgi:hypothetical protein